MIAGVWCHAYQAKVWEEGGPALSAQNTTGTLRYNVCFCICVFVYLCICMFVFCTEYNRRACIADLQCIWWFDSKLQYCACVCAGGCSALGVLASEFKLLITVS